MGVQKAGQLRRLTACGVGCRVGLAVPQPNDGIRFPMLCPTCQAVAGMPCTAGTTINQNGALVVAMQCTDCHYEWRVEMRVTLPVFLPKPDRRRTAKALIRVSPERDSKRA